MLTTELDRRSDGLGVPGRRRAVVPVEDDDGIAKPIGGIDTAGDIGPDTKSPTFAASYSDANTFAEGTVDVLRDDSLACVGHSVDCTKAR